MVSNRSSAAWDLSASVGHAASPSPRIHHLFINTEELGISTYQTRFPQTLTGTKQLLASRPAHDEVLGEIDTPDAVEAADEGLARRLVDTSHDGADEKGTESSLVQR